MGTPALKVTHLKKTRLRRIRVEWRPLLAAAVVALGLGLLFWAQQDLGEKRFSASTRVLLILGGVIVLAGAFLGDLRSLIAARDAPAPTANELPSPREWDLARVILLGLSLVCTVGAFAFNDKNEFSGTGVSMWLMAIGLFLGVWWEPASSGMRLRERLRLPRRVPRSVLLPALATAALVIVVGGLTTFLRFYRLDGLPGNAGGIEADIGNNVHDLVDGRFYVFFPRKIGEGTMLYFTAAIVKFLHVSLDYNVLKFTGAMAGLLAVGATYLLIKEAFSSRLTAFLSSLFMAVAFWPVTISRIALTLTAAPLFTALGLLFLLRALKRGRVNDFLLCGLVAGFGLYFYVGLRIVPLLAAACVGIKLITLLFDRRWQASRALVGRGLLLGIMALIVFAPMARAWHDQPGYYMSGPRSRSQGEGANEFNELGRFGHNLQNAVWMFNWHGDINSLHNIPYRRSLDPAMGAFLLGGGAIAIGGWLFYRRGPFPYLLLAFIAFLLPSVLVLAFPGENPSAGRAAGVMPLTFGVVALPVSFVLSRVYRALSPPAGLAASSLLLVGLMVPIAVYNYNWYFDDYHASYESTSADSSCLADLIRAEKQGNPSLHWIYYIGMPGWVDGGGLQLMLDHPDWLGGQYPVNKDVTSKPAVNSEYVLNTKDEQSLAQLEGFFPSGTAREVQNEECSALFFRPWPPLQ